MSKARKKTEEQIQKKINLRNIHFKKTFSTDAGKFVLEHLKKSCNYGRTAYVMGAPSEDNAFFNGRQSVINEIVEYIETEVKPFIDDNKE